LAKKLEAGPPKPYIVGSKGWDGWDITKQDRPILSPEFLNRFVISEVKGDDDYISVDGLIALAHERGPFEIPDMTIICIPTKDNGYYAAVKVTIRGVQNNKYTGNVEPCLFTEVGDASRESVPNKYIWPHLLRMASTRSVGRALRSYLNIPILTAEEMAAFEGPPANDEQMEYIKELYEIKEFDKGDYRNYLSEIIGRPALKRKNGKKPSEYEADIVIQYLESKPDKDDSGEDDDD
jgi:hypothetical protein